ncbi:MAG TPA: DUF5671 domain-containing protein [Herpetosiphonaceae bacterium]
MTAQMVRRVYIYAAAFLGLQLAAMGAQGMIGALLEQVLAPAALSDTLQAGMVYQLSLNLALLLVGVPLWLGHWTWAQRMQRHPDEQFSALRRLYGYAVLLIAMLNLLLAIRQVLAALFGLQEPFSTTSQVAPAIGALLVWAAVWRYHWRVFSADRPLVEATGAPATLRRWYLVIVQAVSLAVASYAAVDLLHALFAAAAAPTIGRSGIIAALPTLIAGLLVWLPHHLWARMLILDPTPLRADEAASTLRQVYAALVITATAVAGLGAITIILSTVLVAAFGGSAWRMVILDHTQALAVIVIAGALWWYHRRQLTDEARLSEVAARVDTARRVIGYLTAAIGLGALFFGAGGLLSTLLRLVVAADVLGADWREPVSMYLALTMVALPVYGLTARSMEHLVASSPAEERTLARRIYLYAALLFGIVTTIVTGVLLLQRLLSAGLGVAEPGLAVDVARWLAYVLVGGAIAAAYTLLLRRAATIRADTGAGMVIALLVDAPLQASLVATIERELPGAAVRMVDTSTVAQSGEALSTADVLVISLRAALDTRSAELLGGFRGRKLLLATGVAAYELIGARRESAIVREAVRALRTDVPSASPITPPPRSAPAVKVI